MYHKHDSRRRIMYKFICILFIGLTISGSVYAQKEQKFTAKVTVNTFESVLILFDRPIGGEDEYYEIVAKGKTVIKGNGSLIEKLYYEPGLFAYRLNIKNDKLSIFFAQTTTHPERSNILNRVIQIVFNSKREPGEELEIDGYNPLLGATIQNLKPGMRIPPPYRRLK